MARRVSWSPRALADLEAIAAYIDSDSPSYARAVVRRIVGLVRTLNQFPHAGRVVPELDDENLRELLAYNYRIIYRCEEDAVIIAAIIHARRLLQPQ